jgi:cystathionine beta-lyase
LGEKIKFIQNASGAILSPFDSWLVIRGIETLPLRMKQHCHNASIIAEFLEKHPAIDKVHYPGLPAHFNHEVAKKQSSGFGGIVSFSFKQDDEETAIRFVTSTKYFKLAESVGGVKSLCCHPATMTHKSIPVEKRKRAGIAESLVRLSVGLEDVTDLIRDLHVTLDAIVNKEAIPVS